MYLSNIYLLILSVYYVPGNFDAAGHTQLNQTENILALLEPILLWEEVDKSQIYTILGGDDTMTLEILGMLFGNDETPQQRVFLLLVLILARALLSLKMTFYPSAVILCDLVNKNTDSS